MRSRASLEPFVCCPGILYPCRYQRLRRHPQTPAAFWQPRRQACRHGMALQPHWLNAGRGKVDWVMVYTPPGHARTGVFPFFPGGGRCCCLSNLGQQSFPCSRCLNGPMLCDTDYHEADTRPDLALARFVARCGDGICFQGAVDVLTPSLSPLRPSVRREGNTLVCVHFRAAADERRRGFAGHVAWPRSWKSPIECAIAMGSEEDADPADFMQLEAGSHLESLTSFFALFIWRGSLRWRFGAKYHNGAGAMVELCVALGLSGFSLSSIGGWAYRAEAARPRGLHNIFWPVFLQQLSFGSDSIQRITGVAFPTLSVAAVVRAGVGW